MSAHHLTDATRAQSPRSISFGVGNRKEVTDVANHSPMLTISPPRTTVTLFLCQAEWERPGRINFRKGRRGADTDGFLTTVSLTRTTRVVERKV